jgi:hypothetical protein
MAGGIARHIAPVIRSVEVKVFRLVGVGNSLAEGDTNGVAARVRVDVTAGVIGWY